MLLTTRNELDGCRIKKELGLVSGSSVRSRIFFRDFFAGVRAFLGLEVKEYREMMDLARKLAKERMIEEAEKMGANAIVNIRYMTSMTSIRTSEIFVYGTAIEIET